MNSYAGGLVFNTQLDTKGFKDGINQITGETKKGGGTIKNIVAGLGITKLIGMGINAIKNSLDGAISRFDTMNNFPKVMENLGIKAEESEKAIKKLSDGITGLPTTLDDAALAVEKFTSANSDVEKSTEIFLAANDAIVAGGASAEIQKNAMEQLSQAYAKGKPDMMEWRALQTAMPGQLKQVATAMGYAGGNVAQLGEDLRKGNVPMDKFMDTIVRLDKEGLPGFKNFADQAQDSVGGIGTSITNAKTALVRGVTTMITTINNGMKKAKMGSIAENISKFGKKAEEVLKNVGKAISRIPFDKVIAALKKLIPLIGAIVAGMIAYNAALKVMAAINAAKTFISMLNPVGLAVAAIGGLVAAIILLTQEQKKNKTETEKNNEALKEYKTSMDEAKTARQEYLNENMGEVSHYQELYNELEGIVDINGKIKKGYEERANFIVTTLNDALGTEIKITDGVVQNYDKMKSAIQEVIDKKRAQVFLDAHEKEYNEALKQKEGLYKTYISALNEVNKKETEREKQLQRIADALNVSTDELQQFIDKNGNIDTAGIEEYIEKMVFLDRSLDPQTAYNAMDNYRTLNSELAASNDTLDKTRKSWEENSRTLYDYEKALGLAKQGNYDAIYQMWSDTSNYQGKTTQATIDNINKRKAVEEDAIARLKQQRNDNNQDYIDSEIRKHEATIKELNKGLEQYKQSSKNEQATIKGVWNQGMRDLLNDLTGKDVQFKRTANGNIQMYVNGIAQGKPMTERKAKQVADGVVKELNKAKKGGKTAGIDVIKGVDDGINYKKGTAYSTIANFGKTLLNKLKASLKEHSPSKATREMGINLNKGMIEGINDNKKDVLKAADNFGAEILSKMQQAVTLETGNVNASTMLKANADYNSAIVLNANFDGSVEIDGKKAGRILAPEVTKTIKVAGGK